MIGRPIPQGFTGTQLGFYVPPTTAAGGSGFTDPTSITGLQAWFDFTAAANLLNGLDVPPSNGETIKQATDRSGNGKHATQGTDGARPTWVADAGLGFGAGNFATDNQLDFASSVALSTGAFTVVLVGTRGFGEDAWVGHSDTNSAVTSSSATVVRAKTATGTNRDFTVANMGTSGHVVICSRTAGGAISVWLDGVPSATNTISDAGAFTLSRLGVRGTTGFLDGLIGHLCLYDSDLSVANKNLIGDWMADQFGVTWTTIT